VGTEHAAEALGSRRVQILDFIKSNPGTHMRRIKRELKLAMGVIQYHLYRLEKDHSIVSRRQGLYRRFYPSLGFRIEEQEILSVLSQETERDLVLYLIKNPGASQKELSEFAHIGASATSWHMKRLVEAGLLRPRREGLFVCYTVVGDTTKILTLLKSYHPRVWSTWAERLADLLT